jgi:hypothetical protein
VQFEMTKRGARRRNTNAAAHNLYSQQPPARIAVAPTSDAGALAEFAVPLADAASWLAEALARGIGNQPEHPAQAQITLYAGVAAELYQLGGELRGGTGIKPAPLGTLSDDHYHVLQRDLSRQLSLVLSQITSAIRYLRAVEETSESGLVETQTRLLTYLASHMRTAKRMIREMAGNVAWRERGTQDDSDIAARLLAAIESMRQ